MTGLSPFNPATSIYDDLTHERMVHGAVAVEPTLGSSGVGVWDGGFGNSADAGDASRVVFEDSGGVVLRSGWVSAERWAELLGSNTDDGASNVFLSLPMTTLGYDATSLTARVEGFGLAVWLAFKEFDGINPATWTGYTKVVPSDGDKAMNLGVNGADEWRAYFWAKP
jgi:hypothetical protein